MAEQIVPHRLGQLGLARNHLTHQLLPV
jgi:hypothetical protein